MERPPLGPDFDRSSELFVGKRIALPAGDPPDETLPRMERYAVEKALVYAPGPGWRRLRVCKYLPSNQPSR